MNEFKGMLNKVASSLIEKGRQDLADEVTKIASEIEKQASIQECLASLDMSDDVIKNASEMIASEYAELKEASEEYASAHAEIVGATRALEAAQKVIEAAKAKKKKWIQKIDLKKGRLTSYKKPGESMEDAARRALKSDNPSLRGAGGFYLSTQTFKNKKKGKGHEASDSTELPEGWKVQKDKHQQYGKDVWWAYQPNGKELSIAQNGLDKAEATKILAKKIKSAKKL